MNTFKCGKTTYSRQDDEEAIKTFEQSMAHGASEFGLSMAKLLYKEEAEKNVLFSPINIYSALALVLLGSDGETFEEIAALMGLQGRRKNDEETSKTHEILGRVMEAIENTADRIIRLREGGEKNMKSIINITNGVFVQDDVNFVKSYVTQARSFYKSKISNVDFRQNPSKATDIINEFISESTQKRIPQLFKQPVDSDTRIILASCVYFKATWDEQFHKGATKDENFYTGSDNTLVKMMHFEKEIPYVDLPDLHLEAVRLKYEGNDVSMIVILPKPEKTLGDLISSLRVEDLQQIVDHRGFANVDLKLPRMRFKWESDMNNYLVQLGLKKVFSDQCELNNMVSDPSLKISNVTHAAEIEVDENGTEASAVTAVRYMLMCYREPEKPKQFHVNRPFLFYIYHQKTKTILFLGAVHNPQTA
ncbi:leukocyte elastase inhibitor-like [Planococcus citri]|uniref:leukocyte elastase inhibitor-like n=1 Tax=Planococcus citri TaxID=170843 RepID=UPI0031F988BD